MAVIVDIGDHQGGMIEIEIDGIETEIVAEIVIVSGSETEIEIDIEEGDLGEDRIVGKSLTFQMKKRNGIKTREEKGQEETSRDPLGGEETGHKKEATIQIQRHSIQRKKQNKSRKRNLALSHPAFWLSTRTKSMVSSSSSQSLSTRHHPRTRHGDSIRSKASSP